ncbi:MAG: hypothetical protein M0D55_06880 [Elusimicrobiota bacterium]|nr:MAG: hypothetical protein M0D55_06880 [Elusimicrobiota bacterium]
MNTRNRIVTTFVVMAVGAALGTALASRLPGKLAGQVLDRSKICMVNDAVMGQPQLPVEVGGKTYYGCCAGCVGRLNKDRKARVAVDPVSGRDVDKSEAVILQGGRGEALYFESEETARQYQGRASAGS